ncbi:cytochrome c peroxidase [Rubrivirga sp. IMCC45206]|uniref:cytochrome c peroxidase n=1 Tax=Rubrivirga sp. IMCC45206 TaxID=3391614 RepID=UPI00398FC766
MPRLVALAAVSTLVVLGAFTARVAGTPVLPDTPYAYDTPLPAHLRTPPIRDEDNTPAGNVLTDEGATLGRVLFYDVRLSQNETVACGSCHLQERGFSDPARLSVGFLGGETARNSMGLAFARYYRSGRFFWDERAATLEEQTLLPIQDHVEMGMTLPEVEARLAATDFYPDLFADAFGSPEVTSARVSQALAQFVRSIVAPNSRYDQARAAAPNGPPGQPLAGLTAQENQGMQLFFGPGRCAQCHTGDLFVGDQARNNGLDATVTDEGAGNGRFKTGSLRNIALTAPYMHDGRFVTLADVVQHYSTGVQNSPDLDNRLRNQNGQPRRPSFNAGQRAALVAFLETLTDETMATDPRWSDPFVATPTAAEEAPPAAELAVMGANPTRGPVAFRIRLASPADVRLDVFSTTGRRVATLLDGPQAGEATARWDPAGVAAGVYLARLVVGGAVVSRTVTVAR